ncbi:MAG: hypothetical protein EBS59_04960 [Verrucomicrobia bacterium]|nr:hypothetical protein [Verrucomicrobiota bacterium]
MDGEAQAVWPSQIGQDDLIILSVRIPFGRISDGDEGLRTGVGFDKANFLQNNAGDRIIVCDA